MAIHFYVASVLLVGIVAAHSYLGERYILTRLFRRSELPELLGGTEFTRRMLRFAWHITSIAWLGLAALLLVLAHPPVTQGVVSPVLAVTLLATALAIFVGSRARHLAWIVFLAAGLIARYPAVM